VHHVSAELSGSHGHVGRARNCRVPHDHHALGPALRAPIREPLGSICQTPGFLLAHGLRLQSPSVVGCTTSIGPSTRTAKPSLPCCERIAAWKPLRTISEKLWRPTARGYRARSTSTGMPRAIARSDYSLEKILDGDLVVRC